MRAYSFGMDRDEPLTRNLRILPLVYAFTGSAFVIPVIVPYLQGNGLTLREVFLLQTVYAGTLLTMEIPTGYLSDRWGRVNTAILGSLLRLVGALGYFIGHGFWGFVIAEFLWSCGSSCHSGTLDALTYDTLSGMGKTGEYRRIIGHQRSLFFGGEALTSAVAGLFAVINLRFTVALTVLTFSCGLIATVLLAEPQRHTMAQERHWDSIKRIAVTTARSRILRGVIALYSIVATLGLSLFWFTQPYQMQAGLPLVLFGVAHAAVVGGGALAARFAHLLERFFSDRITLLLIVTVTAVGYLALGSGVSLGLLPFFILVRMAWAMISPITMSIGNAYIDERDRATVLSIKAFGHRLLFTLTVPVLGYMTDVMELHTAILITGMIGAFLGALVLLRTWSVWECKR